VSPAAKRLDLKGPAAVGLILGVSACTNPYDPVQRFVGGGLIGAGSGAAIGAAAAGGHGAALGAAVHEGERPASIKLMQGATCVDRVEMSDGPVPDDLRAKVFKDRAVPGNWRVEKMDEDGGYDVVKVFAGPDARDQAIRYAVQEFGDYDEIRLEPYQRLHTKTGL
jgi:hypothetical protein